MRELQPLAQWRADVARTALTFLICFAAVATGYSRTNITFMRAESGWFQLIAHSPPKERAAFCRNLWRHSRMGHYAPVAFWLELKQTSWVGTNAAYWKWRAIIALSLIATLIISVTRANALWYGANSVLALSCGIALAAILVFQPLMLELVGWPFLILQLVWVILTLLALRSCIGMVTSPRPRKWIWLAAFSAYGSMHLLGLGLATALATSAILAGVLRNGSKGTPQYNQRRTVVLCLVLLLALTSVHGAGMALFSTKPKVISSLQSHYVAQLGGLFILLPLYALQSLVLPTPIVPTYWRIGSGAWPFGLMLLVLGTLLCARSLLLRKRESPLQPNVLSGVFAFVSLVVLIAMTGWREFKTPSGLGLLGYASGARYLVPTTFILLGGILPTVKVIRKLPSAASAFFLALAAAALASHFSYQRLVYPFTYPTAIISHNSAWKLIKQMAIEARAQRLPVPNVPLEKLTGEFKGWDLALFAPVLRDDLGLPHQEQLQFVPLQVCLSAQRAEYATEVPSLARLQNELGLKSR